MALPALSAFANSSSIVTRITHNGDLADSVGANTLANTGVTFASAQFGAQAGTYNGTTTFGSVLDAAGNSWTGDLSATVHANRSANPSVGAWRIYLAKWLSTGNQRSFAWGMRNNSGTMQHYMIMSVNGSASVEKSVNMSNASTAADIQMGFSYDASAGTLIFTENGVQVGAEQSGLPTSIFNGTAPLDVGKFGNLVGGFYAGTLQDLVIWTADQTTDDMLANYNAYFATPFTPKIFWF